MKAKYEEKFIVINTKIFDEMEKEDWILKKHPEFTYKSFWPSRKKKEAFLNALEDLKDWYEILTKKKLNQKYYICNQDEPYAKEVIDIILKGESLKNKKK
jgi:hypothetical protein